MAIADHLYSAFLSINARNESDSDLLGWFIFTDMFWRMFSDQHTITMGSPGSGKTLLSKMASYPLLVQSEEDNAKEIINSKKFVGVFVNTDLRFVGATRSAIWRDDAIADEYFVWKFNLNCMKSLCTTIDSILKNEVSDHSERIRLELLISERIGDMIGYSGIPRLAALPSLITNFERDRRAEISSRYLNGEPVAPVIAGLFCTEIMDPIQATIQHFSELLPEFARTNWLFFIDEAEFLTSAQLKILNSFMRTHSEQIFLKIATLPHHYSTLETNLNFNEEVQFLREKNDFQFEILDASPTYDLNSENSKVVYDFARKLYARRVKSLQTSGSLPSDEAAGFSLSSLDLVLGGSRLLDPKKGLSLETKLQKLDEHVDEATFSRAQKLQTNPTDFDEQIWRKVSGVVALRDEIKLKTDGRKAVECYAGVKIVVRCTDGVPRKMISLFQLLAKEAAKYIKNRRGNYLVRGRAVINARQQNRILVSYGGQHLDNSWAVPRRGPDLRLLLTTLAKYFKDRLHKGKISSDYVMSFDINDQVPEEIWDLVKLGIAYGFIYENLKPGQPKYSRRSGSFRISYTFAPYFNLYPAKGMGRSIIGILRQANSPLYSGSINTIDRKQLDLFLDYKNETNN